MYTYLWTDWTDHRGTCTYHRAICIYERTNVPGSSEPTWTPFHHPLLVYFFFYPFLTCVNRFTWTFFQTILKEQKKVSNHNLFSEGRNYCEIRICKVMKNYDVEINSKLNFQSEKFGRKLLKKLLSINLMEWKLDKIL